VKYSGGPRKDEGVDNGANSYELNESIYTDPLAKFGVMKSHDKLQTQETSAEGGTTNTHQEERGSGDSLDTGSRVGAAQSTRKLNCDRH
jgi:hypothetical protein